MSESVASRLAGAGLRLPSAPSALGQYLPAVRAGALVFTAGQLPMLDGEPVSSGIVSDDADVEMAKACARQCALNALAAASTVCDLDEVARVIKVTGYVACSPSFTRQPAIVDGASEVLITAFGDSGRHAREAVGVAALPLGSPVEVSLVLELRV